MSIARSLFLLAGTVIAVLPLAARQSDAVTASATAAPAYVRPTLPDGTPRPETYVFAQGKYFENGTVDGGLAQTSFDQITRTLANSLVKQKYFPIKDPATADLLILVHWGTTQTYEDPVRDHNTEALSAATAAYAAGIQAVGHADTGAVNQALDDQGTAQDGTQSAIDRNAVLLGYGRSLAKERQSVMPTTAEQTMSDELNEERYFIILQAFDNQVWTKQHKPKLLWVTRLSVRSPSNNFVEALPAMSRSGAEVYGKQIDNLVHVKGSFKPGTVILHELQILGTVPEAPAKTDKDK